MTAPYVDKSLERPSFFLRLLGKQPKRNGLIAINNLLAAAENIEDVSVEQVEHAAVPYRLRIQRDLKQEREDLFREGQVGKALEDRNLTDEEEAFLVQLGEDLRLPTEISESIFASKAQEIVQRALHEATSDQRLSPSEETEFQALAKNLGVEVTHDDETHRVLERMRLYWRLEEGDLPVVDVDIKLQRRETCHFTADVDWLEHRKVTRRYNYSGPTARIRIVKGVYWRLGSMAIKPTSEDVLQHIDSGTIYVTNKRVLFRGERGNKSLRLNRIIDVEAYRNGVQIEKDRGKNPFLQFEPGADVMGMILERAIDESV